jgi:hypothetical protein
MADQAMYTVKRVGKNGFCVHGREPVIFGEMRPRDADPSVCGLPENVS